MRLAQRPFSVWVAPLGAATITRTDMGSVVAVLLRLRMVTSTGWLQPAQPPVPGSTSAVMPASRPAVENSSAPMLGGVVLHKSPS